MDNIFFYDKKPERIKRILPYLSFDLQFNPKVEIIDNSNQIHNKLAGKEDALLYYVNSKMTNVDRMLLNQVSSRIENLHICLLSQKDSAMLAWEHELFDFKNFPVRLRNIYESYDKFIRSMGRVRKFIPLKSSEGVFKIPVKNISYLEADGSYTRIYRNTGEKTILLSRQLKEMESLLHRNKNIKRIHKKYIINLSNIKSIDDNEIIFYGKSKVLSPVSRELGRRIRKEILKKW